MPTEGQWRPPVQTELFVLPQPAALSVFWLRPGTTDVTTGGSNGHALVDCCTTMCKTFLLEASGERIHRMFPHYFLQL